MWNALYHYILLKSIHWQLMVVRVSKHKWQDILVGENLVRYEVIAGAKLQRLGYPLMSLK
jgi:hypothetical protein